MTTGTLKAKKPFGYGSEAEAEFVRWAFSVYADGQATLAQIAAEANRRFPRHRRRWVRATVRSILRSLVYAGKMLVGVRRPDGWERTEERDGILPAIIEQDTFDAVQKKAPRGRGA